MSGRYWTTGEVKLILELYPNTPWQELTTRLKRPLSSIRCKAKQLSLKRSPEFLASGHSGRMRPGDTRGMATRYRKGDDRHSNRAKEKSVTTVSNSSPKGLPAVSEEMLQTAMAIAVESGLVPKHLDPENYVAAWTNLKAVLQAAIGVSAR